MLNIKSKVKQIIKDKYFWGSVLLLTVFIPWLNGEVEELNFERLTQRDGLSNNVVSCVLQDRRGFIWVGTSEGLNRYDGYSFEVFLHQPDNPYSLGGNGVTSLWEDHYGVLWIGTDGGLNKYDPQTERFARYRNDPNDPNSIGSNDIKTICEDRQGELWIGNRYAGLNRLDRQKGQFFRYRLQTGEPKLDALYIDVIYPDSQGMLWIGTEEGLVRFNPQTGESNWYRHNPQDPSSLSSNGVRAIREDKSGALWIGTQNSGLNRWDRNTQRFTHFQKSPGDTGSISSNSVLSIIEDRDGILWVGTANGLNRLLDREKGYFISYRNVPNDSTSLSNDTVYSIYQDAQGLLWLGTWGGGVNLLDKEGIKFKYLRSRPDTPNTLNDNMVFAVFQDPAGIVWIGTWQGGLNKYNPATGTFTYYRFKAQDPKGLGSSSIRAIIPSRRGGLWIGTLGGGLEHFDPISETFTHYKHNPNIPNSISSDSINALIEDQNGITWIGTRLSGLDRYDPAAKIFTHYKHDPHNPNSIIDNAINALYEDQAGILRIGTDTAGLDSLNLDTKTFTHFKNDPNNPNSLSHNQVKIIYQDNNKNLWIGTRDGLNKFEPDKNQWTIYTAKEGLPDNVIYGILGDGQANLWLSTNKGLAKFNPRQGTFITYTTKDGLPDNEFNTGAYYKNPLTGEMFFGTMGGLVYYDPGKIKDNTYIPPVAITAVKQANQPVAAGTAISQLKEISLYQKGGPFSIEFAALNYKNPEENRYAYKLEGVDKEWVYCGTNHQAVYDTLPVGTYLFRVMGSNDDGYWNREGAAMTLVILPPSWKTWWFQLLAAALVLFIIYSLHRLRTRTIRAREAKLSVLVAERTRELQQRQEELEAANRIAQREKLAAQEANRYKSDFLARMSHEIRTPMNAIMGFGEMLLETRLDNEQLEYVRTITGSSDSLLTLINDILDFSRVEAGQLTLESIDFDPEVMVFDVCELMQPRMGEKSLEIICRIDDRVPPNVKGDPGRLRQILVNLMSNAVKFTETGEIELSLDVENEDETTITLRAAVRDTGIGISKDKQEAIFDVFQQGDGSITRQYGGSGLGLAICKQLTKLMSGQIGVTSEPGKGSTFYFTSRLEKSAKKPGPRIVPGSLAGKKVLIVDDNPHNLEILAHQLTTAGMKVQTLKQGTEVIPTLLAAVRDRAPFDLCILDIRMPDFNGFEVAKQIRAPGSPLFNIPLVAYTSSYSKRAQVFIDSGFDAFLPKPVQRKKIIEALEQLLGRSEEKKAESPKNREAFITRHSLLDNAKQSIRILLVEDNPVNQKLAVHLLTKAGYTVEVVGSGKEAIDTYTDNHETFDLIFMDVQMPDMDGKEVARAIRNRGFHDIPIIAMTAQAMKGDRDKCLEAGMNDYISKPIKREVVFEMVKKWALDKRSATAAY